MTAAVDSQRFRQRLKDVSVVDTEFGQGRLPDLDQQRTSQSVVIDQAVRMMDSTQLKAFDLSDVPLETRNLFGDSPFGRGCLAAARLIEVGVRCIEVTLSGWDSHVTNHELQTARKADLDPALAGLIRYLRERSLLDQTLVVCGGEFGRTPSINPAGGRDHWPHGFSIALAGGGLPGGRVIGETDPEGSKLKYEDGITVADIHASLLHRLGIDPTRELITPIGRPIKLSEGRVVL